MARLTVDSPRNINIWARKGEDESPASWALNVVTAFCYLEHINCTVRPISNEFGIVLLEMARQGGAIPDGTDDFGIVLEVTREDGANFDAHGAKGVRESTARLLSRGARDEFTRAYLANERAHIERGSVRTCTASDDDRDIILAEVYVRLGALSSDLRLWSTEWIEQVVGLTH